MTSSNDDRSGAPFDVPDFSDPAPLELSSRHSCVDCGLLSPKVATNHTLISSRYGWRLHREVDSRSGDTSYEWRCPGCWSQFRTHRSTS